MDEGSPHGGKREADLAVIAERSGASLVADPEPLPERSLVSPAVTRPGEARPALTATATVLLYRVIELWIPAVLGIGIGPATVNRSDGGTDRVRDART